jgi:hypothetical protein
VIEDFDPYQLASWHPFAPFIFLIRLWKQR